MPAEFPKPETVASLQGARLPQPQQGGGPQVTALPLGLGTFSVFGFPGVARLLRPWLVRTAPTGAGKAPGNPAIEPEERRNQPGWTCLT
jgi:hypothetical protein